MAVAAACGGVSRAADTLDSVVASIGRDAITASDVEQEYRFERFLDAQWPAPAPNSAMLASARERLIDQRLLIADENPGLDERAESAKSAAQRVEALRKAFAPPQGYQRGLTELGMTEPDVIARVAAQELTLRLIDERLRPEATPSDEEVAAYYHSNFAPAFQQKNSGAAAPPLEQVDSQIRELLTQKRIDDLLDQWIEELKTAAGVRFHSF